MARGAFLACVNCLLNRIALFTVCFASRIIVLLHIRMRFTCVPDRHAAAAPQVSLISAGPAMSSHNQIKAHLAEFICANFPLQPPSRALFQALSGTHVNFLGSARPLNFVRQHHPSPPTRALHNCSHECHTRPPSSNCSSGRSRPSFPTPVTSFVGSCRFL